MARTKISEFSATAADNTDIDSIDIAEGCAPSGINNAIRELMAQLKDFQTGAAGDPFNGAVNGTVGATTPAAGAFTTLSASSTVSGTGFSNYLASPPAIGGTAAAAGTFTNLAYTGTLTGGTGVINIGSGQLVKDSSGNLGLGVTPSAWGSTWKAAQIGIVGAVAAQTNSTAIHVSSNEYIDGSSVSRYIASDFASKYRQLSGGHFWFTAPSGTAGNAISFTQAMTLTSDGWLGLGTSAPNSNGGAGSGILHINSGNTNGWAITHYTNATTGFNASDGAIVGLIGSDLYVGNYEAANLIFGNNGFTERARFSSNGDFLIGTTTNPSFGSKVRIVSGGGNIIETVQVDAATRYHHIFVNSNGGVGAILTTNSTTTYETSSDYRLKNITGDLTNSGVFIDALKPKVGTWKADGSPFVGFLAHEFQEISPSSVSGEKDAVDENGNPIYQGMQASSSEVMANIIAELQSLRKRVAELEAA